MHAILGARVEALCAASQVRAMPLIVEGDLTPETIEALRAQAGRLDADMVVAVGGGKALDAGKAVARSLHCHLITVPTAASNDAPPARTTCCTTPTTTCWRSSTCCSTPPSCWWTPPSSPARRPPSSAPGWATPCPRSSRPSSAAATADQYVWRQAALAAQLLAEGCLRILLEDGAQALAAAGTGRPTPAFERAVEAMILLSGLGFESGGLSIAHALTRGLPRIAGLATSAHGLQVALGLLVQLDLEARDDGLLAELTRWYAQVGLPVSLRELGATAPTDAELETAAALTLNARHAANFDRTLSVAGTGRRAAPARLAAWRRAPRRARWSRARATQSCAPRIPAFGCRVINKPAPRSSAPAGSSRQ